GLKARRAIVVLIAHRPAALLGCDQLLVLANGVQQGFGPREEILRKVFAHRTAPAAAGNLKVVYSNSANELLRSPYAPTRAHERPGPERHNVENDPDLLRSSFAPKRARTQPTVDAGVPAGEDAAPRSLEPERLRPPPAMTRRDKLRWPLVAVLIAAML